MDDSSIYFSFLKKWVITNLMLNCSSIKVELLISAPAISYMARVKGVR